jgi:hypothetical protein
MFFQDNVIWMCATVMHTLRLAYATQYLIALIAIYVLWSQVGGQSHLDLMPWYVKLALGAGAALAVVKATTAAVSQEHAWNGRTLKWCGILLVLLLGCGLASYYCHLYLEDNGDDQSDDNTAVGWVMRGHSSSATECLFTIGGGKDASGVNPAMGSVV